jgi:hypothetical protein
VFSLESDGRLYIESLFVAKVLEIWNWEFKSYKRIVVEEPESREWEYNREYENEK